MGRDTLDLGSWIVLRMASADTLRVFRSLRDAGFDVWTPVERLAKRMPRTRAQFDKDIALMPSYVFANVAHLADMANLAMIPNREHPPFSLFRYQGGIPLIAEEQLAPLRAEEDRRHTVFAKWRRRGMKAPPMAEGSSVRMTEGPFAGLTGIVEGAEGQYTLVSIDGFHKPLKISSLLLLDESVISDGKPEQGTAAKAA